MPPLAPLIRLTTLPLLRVILAKPSHTQELPLYLHRAFTSLSRLNMRVPYAPKEAPTEADKPIYDRIAARRAPRPLIPLDLALLHNTAIADGWSSFIGAVRTKNSLPEDLKELAIARVAVLNHAVHEWDIHAALALKGGVTKEGLETAFTIEVCKKGQEIEIIGDGEQKGGLTKTQWAVLRYTDQMTRGIEVDDGVAEGLKKVLSDKEVVELTATVAAYNCVSRFLVALDVGECNGRAMKKVDEL